MKYLNSSAIQSVDYDAATGNLEIWFISGRSFTYHEAPERVYHRLITAISAGEYYNAHIKGRYA